MGPSRWFGRFLPWRRPALRHALPAAALALLAACTSAPSAAPAVARSDTRDDPLEPVNRKTLAFDEFLDRHTLKPVARAYRDYVPDTVQHRLHDLLANLEEPEIEVNDLLQGNFDRGWITFQRFIVNTTAGGLGLFDVARRWDLPFHDADYGQTLAVWGVGTGPYLVLPVFGPSNVRDAVGTGLGFVLDPLGFVGGANAAYAGYARGATGAVDDRADQLDTLDELEENSIDFYAALRSMYRQHRTFEVNEARGHASDDAKSSVTLDEPEMTSP
jgi:phospholipid-binding lipoprotein MlaA